MRTRFVFVVTFLLAGASAAFAAGHRARLSADLQDHLNAGSQTIEVIVHGDRATIDAIAARYNLVVSKYLASGAVLRVTAGQLAALQQDEGLDHLSGNTPLRVSDAITAESTGADQVWAGSNDLPALSGEHVTVAVIDSGMDPTHAALKGRIVATQDFTGGDGVDRFGHGTHVAGIIAGARVSTPDGLDYRGIAYGARLVNLRVLDANGAGTVADVVDAIDWAVSHREQYTIRVINLSLGAPVLQPYADDPMCEAVDRAARAGIVVIASAGNYGQTADGKTVLGSITSPANSPYAIAVGATDTHGTADRSDDTLEPYSSRGPTPYDLLIKPDLVAPGHRIVSAEASNAYLPTTYPARHITGQGPNAYFRLSGTSMSAAVVSGAAALLLDDRGTLRPFETKAALQLAATFMPEAGLIGAGAGNLNVLAATELVEKGHLPTFKTQQSFGSNGRPTTSLQFLGRNVTTNSIVWGVDSSSIVWGVEANSIVWGLNPASIVWGVQGNSIVWGMNPASIVWGVKDNSIVWGVSDSSTVWGVSDASIVWGVNAESIVWGVNSSSIVWGVDSSSIVWGVNADSIVWGIDF